MLHWLLQRWRVWDPIKTFLRAWEDLGYPATDFASGPTLKCVTLTNEHQLMLFSRVSLKQVINAVADGSEFLWKQKTEMIMAGHERSRSKLPSKNLLTVKRKETGEKKHFLLIFKSYLFWQRNGVHIWKNFKNCMIK